MAQDESARTNDIVPYALAMVVCDAIWRDPGTGKRVLLGVFSAIQVRKFPSVHPIMAVHVAVTDGHGRVSLRLRLIDAGEEREPLFEASQEVAFPDPLAIVEWDYHLYKLRFDTPGEYRFQLFAGNAPLIERRFLVLPASAEGE